MTREERPWWSSDGEPDDAANGAARSADPGADPGTEQEPERSTHDPEICGVCPICIGGRMLQDGHPELYAHLSEAARHLAAAVRTLLDTEVEQAPTSAAEERVTRIDLD